MECKKIMNLLDNKPDQPFTFRKKIGMKKMKTHAGCKTLIVKSN